ncbi:hypothetical protein ACKI1H_28350 [Pseudomonas sp. YH-1]|uniref:hypothetical protein n=1 Tax=Pseudomonas sp. YH-1 TaxID=3384787 RepID=UPI003F7E3B3A
MGLHLRLAIAAVVVLFSGGAHALTPYYWIFSDRSGPNFDSPASACSDTLAYLQRINQGATVSYSGYVMVGADKASCNFSVAWPSTTVAASQGLTRVGDGCAQGSEYNPATAACEIQRPSDAECKTRDKYTKAVQFVFTDGGAVLDLDPEIKDGCVYEPGSPENCNDNVCTVDMNPVGNDDMSDNPDNPDQQLQDYLDQLAKQFKCEKTANGTVGCTGAQTTPSDIDPDDKCPDGYSWSGTACFPTTGGGNENPDNPGGNTGGGDGGNNGGDGGTDPGTGNGDGGGSTGGGTGGGDGGTNGGDGPKESLVQPKQGSWDEALETWSGKVEDAKKEFSEKIKENADQLKGVFDLNLGEGGGKLPCDTFVVWKKTVSLCFTPYEEKLSYLRYALMFMASVLAAFVILKE